MARKSMKSRVPADVWSAMTALRQGDVSNVEMMGSGGQGEVFAVRGNEEWVIKRWYSVRDEDNCGWASACGWRAKDLAKAIAHGRLADKHLPNIIYAVGRYVVMERLAEEVAPAIADTLYMVQDTPARYLSRGWRPLRRAMRKLERAGYAVNDIVADNVMHRKDGTIVLNDVVA